MLESKSMETYATASMIHGNTEVELSQDSLALDFSVYLPYNGRSFS